MHILKRSLLLLGVTALTLTACKDDEVAPDTIAVTNITVTPAAVSVQAGQSTTVTAQVSTNGGTGTIDLGVTWTSGNTSVATITNAGVITGQAAGTTTVTAKSNANAAYQASVNVTVTAVPALTPALTTFEVTPTAVSIVSGQTATTSSVETHATGATVTYANTSSNTARCTVPATGANPTITTLTAAGPGNCVITITASGAGANLLGNQIARTIAVTVTSAPTALLSLTLTPTSVNMVPGQTQNVTTTAATSAGASAVTYTCVSSNTAVVDFSAPGSCPTAGNPVLRAVGNGIAQVTVTATSTLAGVSNQISAQIQVNVQAASVSLESVTACLGGPPCVVQAIPLAGVGGQIEGTININSGNQQIGSVALQIGQPVGGSCTAAGVVYTDAATQVFGVNGAPTAPVTLSVNTATFDVNFVPRWLNGLECIRAMLTPVTGPTPNASNTIQFTLINPDVVYFDANVGTTGGNFGLQHTGNSATQATGAANTWWKGGFTFRAHPVLYSGVANVVSITYNSSACGAVAATPPNFSATFSCNGVESAQNILGGAGTLAIAYVPTYTLSASPTRFITVGDVGFVPGNPAFATVTTREDNVGPRTHTPLYVLPGAGGWHGNGSGGTALPTSTAGGTAIIAPTSYTVTATDFGVGGAVAGFGLTPSPSLTQIAAPAVGPFASGLSPATIPLAETLVPSPYDLQGSAVNDILGNVGVSTTTAGGVTACGGGVPAGSTSRCGNSSVLFGVFGVDLVVLDAQYADRTNSATAGVIWQGVDRQIYSRNAVSGGVSTGLGASGIAVTDWDVAAGAPEVTGAQNIVIDAIDSRSGLNNAAALTQKIVRSNAGGTTNCLAFGTYVMGPPILVDNYVQSAPQQFDCGLAAGARVGEYTWAGYVSDRAGNARLAQSAASPPVTGTVNQLRMALDEALPNITGIGFQTALYVGGQPATYSFSANDDLELWQGQITLAYTGHAPIRYPYGASAYTTGAFGTPFDGTFVNVLNGASLTLGYYINQFDFATTAAFVPGAAPSGNVAGFTSGGVNTAVSANVRDVAAQQAAIPLAAPVLGTQLTVRGAAPAYAGSMLDFRIINKGGGVITVQDAAPSSVGLSFCERVDIFEVVEAGGDAIVANLAANNALIGDDVGDALVFRSTVTNVPVPGAIPDNGFQRFLNYVSAAHTNIGTGFYVAGCVKNGSTLLSTTF